MNKLTRVYTQKRMKLKPQPEKDTCPVCGLWYDHQLETCSNSDCEAHHSYDHVPPVIRKAAVTAGAKRICSHPNSNQFTIYLDANSEGEYIGGIAENRYTIDLVVPCIDSVGVILRETK